MMTVVQLSSLLEGSTPLLLAYSVPLLLFSLIVTFSGTFLTLDRTRTFASRSDTTQQFPGEPNEKKVARSCVFRLDGGIGGLLIGFVFGLHTATLLTLLVLNMTSLRPPSSTAFFLIWLFSMFLTMVLGGRWKFAALSLLGISGGITLSLALSIITHPALTSRVVLASVVTPLTTLIVVIPSLLPSLSQSNLAHSTARMASSCSGAFSVTMAIAILTRSPLSHSWANSWERLWIPNGSGWGSTRERGFDALFCLLWVTGALSDWTLRKWVGEDPEEKWDAYLAECSTSLPNPRDRAGQFEPHRAWWNCFVQRLHLTPSSPHGIIFPTEKDFTGKAGYAAMPEILLDVQSPSREDSRRSVSSEARDWGTDVRAPGAGLWWKGKPRRNGGFNCGSGDNTREAALSTATFDLANQPTHLKKKSVRTKYRWHRFVENKRRSRVEFRPKGGFSSESDTEESSDIDLLKLVVNSSGLGLKRASAPIRTDLRASSLSGTTAYPSSSSGHDKGNAYVIGGLDTDSEKARLMNVKASFGGVASPGVLTRAAPEYSDVEEDVTTAYTQYSSPSRHDTSGWKPEFLRRTLSPGVARVTANDSTPPGNTPAPPNGAVPVTPSLVHALGRIAKAQADAYGPRVDNAALSISAPARQKHSSPRRGHVAVLIDGRDAVSGLPVVENKRVPGGEDKVRWNSFWSEIQAKAAEP